MALRCVDSNSRSVTHELRIGAGRSILTNDRLWWGSDLEGGHPQVEGFVEKRTGKGSHLLFVHPESGKEIWGTVHGRDRPARESHPAGCWSGMMATHYPIVFERDSGVFSAYVAGLPVSMLFRRTSRARRYKSPEWRCLHAATPARR